MDTRRYTRRNYRNGSSYLEYTEEIQWELKFKNTYRLLSHNKETDRMEYLYAITNVGLTLLKL